MTTAAGPEYLPPDGPAYVPPAALHRKVGELFPTAAELTAEGERKLSGPPSMGEQVAALAARVMRRTPPRRRGVLADSVVATRETRPDDTTVMVVTPARPETLADVERAERAAVERARPVDTPSKVRLDAWCEYVESTATDLDVLHPEHDQYAGHGAVAALALATNALRHAVQLAAPYLDPTNTVRPANAPEVGRIIGGLGHLHAEVGALVDQLVRQLGTLHQRAIHGEVTAPPGADPFAEIEAVMRDLLAIANNTSESTSRADVAGHRLTRLSWSSGTTPTS